VTDVLESDGPVEEYEFPVTSAQQRLLVLDRLAPGTAQYSLYAAYRVTGGFDTGAFEACVTEINARHEALRTVFRAVDGEFAQIVRARTPTPYRLERAVPAAGADAAVEAAAARPFDIEHGPLARVAVFEVDDGSHRILIAAHHLVADGWSLGVLVRELSECYRRLRSGQSPELPEPAIQYGDYAAWQRERAAAGEFEAQLGYWHKLLADAPPNLPLPADLPRPRVRTPAGGHLLRAVPGRTASALDRIGRELGATPTATLLAAYAVFLGRLCGRRDLVIGLPVAGRDRSDVQDLVGMLVNTVGLRIDLSGGPSFAALVDRVGGALRDARENQDAPFESVVNRLAPDRVLDHDPVYQVVFSHEDQEALPLELPGAEVTRQELFLDVAKFDFMLQAERAAERLSLRYVYRSDLYTPSTMSRWADLFETLLGELVADQGQRSIETAGWLPAETRARLLRMSTGPRTPVPDLRAHQLFESRAAQVPRARAVVTAEAELSYAQLDERAERVAASLRARGIGVGDVVGLCLPRTERMPLAVLGVLKAGAAYLPLEPDYPAERLRYLVADSGAALVLADEPAAAGLAGLDASVLTLRTALGTSLEITPDDAPRDVREPEPDDLAYVIYTSGSTGTPKGVGVSHRSLADYAVSRARILGVDGRSRVAQLGSFSFDASVSDMFVALCAGAELHIVGSHERLGPPLFERLRDAEITAALVLPSVLASLPSEPGALPLLRTLAVGAERLPVDLVRRWAPGRTLVNLYGPTEATVCATAAVLAAGDPVDIGRPLPNARVYVLDHRLEPAPVGVVGEIYIAGPGLARGYIGRPGQTAQAFVADPHGPAGSRMYRTGDLGRYLPSGAIDLLGRSDDQVKVRGYRIEPGEIENALAAHPAVARASVMARADDGETRLVGYFVPRPSAAVLEHELRSWLARRLPAHLVPAAFVRLAEMPLTASGKVNRGALPAPARERPEQAYSYVPPRTGLERRIAAVWARVLRIERIGTGDNFFDLGGDSVRLLAVHTRLATGADGAEPLELDLVDLFRHPTVSTLASHLARAAETGLSERPDTRSDTARARARERGTGRRGRLDALNNRKATP